MIFPYQKTVDLSRLWSQPGSSESKKLLGTEEGKAFNYCLGNLGNNTSLKINKIKNFDNAINNMMET